LKKIDLGQAITILANVGVIAGIVFLGVELRQNNELLTAQASYARFSVERERRTRLMENRGGLGDIIRKKQSGEPLNPAETYQHVLMMADIFDMFRWQFGELKAGRLPDDSIDLWAWRQIWRTNPELGNIIDGQRQALDPEFVQYLEENVINWR